MKQDSEGFLFPAIDESKCIKCKQCKKICPAIVQGEDRKPLNVYATKNLNEDARYQSTSGGMFTLLAENIIHEGGVVFGAQFNDNWKVVHGYAETIEGLSVFRGSKYVQSEIGNMYKIAKDFLIAKRKVLFSGTPCQVAGLKAFLGKEYDNLLTVDLVCHGVPSPLVWKKYLDEIVDVICSNIQRIIGIKFRDKIYGWSYNYIFSISYLSENTKGKMLFFTETSQTNSFAKGFLKNIYLRLSCYKCPVKSLKSGSDITLGDYWKIWNVLPEFDDKKGVSLVMVNTEKGKKFYELLNKKDHETTYAEAIAGNSMIEKSTMLPAKRTLFFEKWLNEPIIPLINKLTRDSVKRRFKKTIIALLRKFKILPFVKALLKRQNSIYHHAGDPQNAQKFD
jgi:coenzyme F420-reducing hydrogenase beta subunit